MKKYIILIAFLPLLLVGQNNGDSLKFEIIRSSINFLATDTCWHIKKAKLISCKSSDYNCLKKYCIDNKMKKADGFIDTWMKNPSSEKNDLVELNNKILNDLTTQKKSYRKKLSGYSKYEKELATLSEKFYVHQNEKDLEEEPESENIDNIATVEKPKNEDTSPHSESIQQESSLPLVSLILSLLALIIGIFVFLKSKAFSEKYLSKFQAMEAELSGLRSKLIQNKSPDSTKNFDDKFKNLQDRVNYLENLKQETERATTEKRAEIAVNNTIKTQPLNYTAFAKIPDLDNGFSKSILLSSQNGEQIYEIQVNGEKATYKITNEANPQKYALTDYNYYLAKACDFQNQPVKNCKINTTLEGTLTLSSGNWIIQSKARIEFK